MDQSSLTTFFPILLPPILKLSKLINLNRLEKLVIWKFIHDTFLTSSPTLFSLSLIYLIYIHSKNFYPINIRFTISKLDFEILIGEKLNIYICIDERIKLNEGKNIERNIQTFHTRERSIEKNYFPSHRSK